MKRLWVLVCLLLGGCNTAPYATFLDYVRPGRLRMNPKVTPHGGVCIPQGMIGGPALPPPPVVPSPGPLPPAPVFPGPGGVTIPPPPAPLR